MKFEAVLWDLDGTLINSEEGIVSAYRHTIKTLCLPKKTDTEIAALIGPPLQRVFATHFGLSPKASQKGADIFRQYYRINGLFQATPYAGIFDVLEAIKKQGIKQAIATNKRQDYATDICIHFGLDKYCYPIFGADNENKLTKADIIEKCLVELDTQNAVMIGDTSGDKIAAENACIDFIGVNYGFGFKDIADYADNAPHILTLLTEWEGK